MMHLLRDHHKYCLNSLRRCGGHRLSHPPRQQSATLSKAGLAFLIIALFVTTIIIAATAAADAIAINLPLPFP
jgi:hypothetical protein